MAKINALPPKVYNRIAAGEVVEKPYSVVKELVENAIDAGATEIEIYVENGGKQLIRVVDNGSGILREDMKMAFMPHATSKISAAEDLNNIHTLGFRGEAIASIASVSKMTITSKTADGKCYKLFCDGGHLGEVTEAAGENGTEVKVEMLFFNTPVRLDFLKSDRAEEADITTFVSRFILCRSDIAFTYYVNGSKVLQSFGGGDEEALVCVYGAAILNNCYEINAERHGIRIRGYIGNQNFSKPNKSYQSVFLNGRYVLNSTITTAVAGAYSNYLMKRQYPFYVLHIDMPPQTVDVNVHPNKTDVRFANNQTVYGSIYSVVSAVLDGKAQALEYVVGAKTETAMPATTEQPSVKPAERKFTKISDSISESILAQAKTEEEIGAKRENADAVFGFPTLTLDEAKKVLDSCAPMIKTKKQDDLSEETERAETFSKGVIPMSEIAEEYPGTMVDEEDLRNRKKRKKNPEKLHKKFPNLYFERNVFEVNDPAYERAKEQGAEEDYFAANKRYLEELDSKAKQNRIEVSSCVYAGKLFNTYLLYEYGQEVYIIDQHAAHERLIFNRLKEKMQNRSILRQPMLLPYELHLNAFEATFIRERLNEIREIGFDIRENGATDFLVTAIPLDLRNIDLGVFFNEILGDVSGYRAIKLEEILKDKLATAACKAAVKGGMDLTNEEVQELLRQMDGDMGLKCPHGRPVVVKMTKTKLEKMFKRIV